MSTMLLLGLSQELLEPEEGALQGMRP